MFRTALFTNEDILKLKNTDDLELKAYINETIAKATEYLQNDVKWFMGFGGRIVNFRKKTPKKIKKMI